MKKWIFRVIAFGVLVLVIVFLMLTFVLGFTTPQNELETASLQAIKNRIPADEIQTADKISYGNTYAFLIKTLNGSLGYVTWQKRLWDTNYKLVDIGQYNASDVYKGFLANDYLSTYFIAINGTKLEYIKSIMRQDVEAGLIAFIVIIVLILLFYILRKIKFKQFQSK